MISDSPAPAPAQNGCPPADPAWPSRCVIAGTLIVVGIVLAFGVVYVFRSVLFCLLVGIVLATAVNPLADWLVGRGMRRAHAVIAIYLGLGAAFIGGLIVGLPIVVAQTRAMVDALPEAYSQLRSQLTDTPIQRINNMAARLPDEWPPIRWDSTAASEVLASLQQDARPPGLIPRPVYLTIAVLLFAFYWSLQGPRTITALLLRVPEDRRTAVREVTDAAQGSVGAFIRGQGMLCLAVGVLSFIAYWWIGLPYALFLALLAGVLELVPYFGPTLGTVPALMVALTSDPSLAIWVIGAAIIIQVLENYLLVPRIMKGAVGVNPVVTLLALVAFGSLFGAMGVILAIPMAAIVQILLERLLLQPENTDPPAPAARDIVSRLRYELHELIQDVRSQLRHKDGPSDDGTDELEDSIEAIAMEFEHELAAVETGTPRENEKEACL